jgi:hypothetical protein
MPGLAVAFALLAGLIAASGCGDGKIPRYPVHGSVNIDGRPADGAMVIFCPVGGSEAVQKTRPFGFTGPDGKFELTTLNKADGSPTGEYKVLIQWPANAQEEATAGRRTLGADRLNGRYMNLQKTQLTATIKDGPTDLPPFELKSQ